MNERHSREENNKSKVQTRQETFFQIEKAAKCVGRLSKLFLKHSKKEDEKTKISDEF